MLNQLGDEKLYYTEPLFVSRSSQTKKITAIAFNYPKEYENRVPGAGDCGKYMDNTSSKTLKFVLTDLKPGTSFEIETLDNTHGNAINDYKAMGSPHSPNREQTALLKDYAWKTTKEIVRADNNGSLTINKEISPWSCLLIREL